MNVVLGVTIGVLAVALAGLGARHRSYALQRPLTPPVGGTQRILCPFIASALSCRALDAALRLARAENATLMPVFLARVPLTLPLDAALPRQSQAAIGLQEAIEHRAAVFGVPVDARIERGRTYRHALRQTIDHERYQRIVVAAAAHGGQLGFGADDVAWLLDNAPGDIVVLRPATDDRPVPIVQTDHGRLHRRPLAAGPAFDGGDDRAPATRTMISRGA
jgi:hypothetical protein